ncbi:MAG: GDP-mannose 4,6-dehydratase, partial [Bdellovibrionia bacterium]
QDRLFIGNLNAERDWGYAKDFVQAMWLMLQQETPDDYVIATQELHSVRELCDLAFHYTGIDLEWKGEGINEKGYDRKTGRVLVEVDPKYFRPAEVDLLLGDITKAKEKLKWKPTMNFRQLIKLMVDNDLTEQGILNP